MVEQIDDMIFEEMPGQGGQVGIITLNRPQALNALTHNMCLVMRQQLLAWADNKQIKCVVVRGQGDKAFCAGGDIRHIYDLGQKKEYALAEQFFWDEYRNNYTIGNYKKPYIALLDGITMGGGVGISIHGSHRIVTEKTLFAMPETGIGFFPDVGGSYFLSRCIGEYGTYLALTGARLDASGLIDAHLADYVVTHHHLPELIEALANTDFHGDAHTAVATIIKQFAIAAEPSSTLSQHRSIIDECFCFDSIEEIQQALFKHNSDWSNEVLKILETKSPTSLKVTLQQIRQGVGRDLGACLQMEYRLCQHFIRDHDFYEGIRALLIDKDKQTTWKPDRLEAVSLEEVERYFRPIKGNELSFV